ncbi:MAG: amidophosphoribosyltransferase [Candidatus Poseidoniia archaeon]|nr:amidophosphoribosyltransferase [Nitrospinota bacterium]MDP7445263.1 amidophosphoribosyltransferase [Candidatus Poseidoniia archaeon]|tara:strand:- start:1558 stop:2166 length:609 start_codon:yes stop_codon:yes gene_type:complete
MNQFEINANDYLVRRTMAFYHVSYTRMGNPGNPNYLNDLKNTYNSFSSSKLRSAVNELQQTLKTDLPQILQSLSFSEMVVCIVPRAKAESDYHANQQLFRTTVQTVIRQIPSFVDGTSYLRRHTDTKTTHFRRPIPNYTNEGPEPYPGITEETCEISPNIRDNDILLVDDIYTPDVNIDEDAINTLFRAGARTVIFYAVGKV